MATPRRLPPPVSRLVRKISSAKPNEVVAKGRAKMSFSQEVSQINIDSSNDARSHFLNASVANLEGVKKTLQNTHKDMCVRMKRQDVYRLSCPLAPTGRDPIAQIEFLIDVTKCLGVSRFSGVVF